MADISLLEIMFIDTFNCLLNLRKNGNVRLTKSDVILMTLSTVLVSERREWTALVGEVQVLA